MLIDAITSVVADMKALYVLNTISVTTGILTGGYQTNINIFKVGMYVEFEGYKGKRFKIETITNVDNIYTFTCKVPNLFDVSNIKTFNLFLNFYPGHAKEIQKDLLDLIPKKFDQYPFLAMFLNVKEKRGTIKGVGTEAPVNFAIIIDAQKKWRSLERHEKSFKTILYPIYELFLRKLYLSGLFEFDEDGLIEHDYADNYHYSADEAAKQNTLAVIADAIEINNLELILIKNNCYE